MDVRLVQLLGSFIGVTSDYALARLEYALKHPRAMAPPLIARLPDASESTLRLYWPSVEAELEAALKFAKHLRPRGGKYNAQDASVEWLRRTLKELDQYARAIRWVMTVTER
ncbi:MAG: hypothetical protein JO165_04040 [Candidatus Eremiobacteraeota bacterium]|nr:hypothetical protein [Candidatus Eremiobacteraeota bacterium]